MRRRNPKLHCNLLIMTMTRLVPMNSFTITLYLLACSIASGYVTTNRYDNGISRSMSMVNAFMTDKGRHFPFRERTSRAFDNRKTRLLATSDNQSNLGGGRATSAVTATSATTATLSPSQQQQQYQLSPLEIWCTSKVEQWYTKSLSLKCPFMRRRMADLVDGMDEVMRFLIIRHKSLEFIGPPPGCRCTKTMSSVKHTNLSMDELLQLIRNDWNDGSNGGSSTNLHRGYYITGRLNTSIYRDDCYFDGPDPDMPVRGLRKYLNAASQLFDHKTSRAELLSIDIVDAANAPASTTDDNSNSGFNALMRSAAASSSSSQPSQQRTIVARWKLQGVLHLPWKPKLPVWTGSTTYHFDEQGMYS